MTKKELTATEKDAEVAHLKSLIDEYRSERDLLDAQGSQSGLRDALATAIERCRAEIKDLTGEDS